MARGRRGYGIPNPNGFGSFAEGLLGGIERAQDMRTRYETNLLQQEQRADRQRARDVMQGIPTTVEGMEQQATSEQFVAPYADPNEAIQQDFNPRSYVESLRAQANMIEDPDRRKAAMDRIEELEFRGVQAQAVAAHQAWTGGDQQGTLSALNRGYSYLGSPGEFKVDANGTLVAPDGETVDDKYFATMAQMLTNPTEGMKYMREQRLAEAETEDSRKRKDAAAVREDKKLAISARLAAVQEGTLKLSQAMAPLRRDEIRSEIRKNQAEIRASLLEMSLPDSLNVGEKLKLHESAATAWENLKPEMPGEAWSVSPEVQALMADENVGPVIRSFGEGLTANFVMASNGTLNPQQGVIHSSRLLDAVLNNKESFDIINVGGKPAVVYTNDPTAPPVPVTPEAVALLSEMQGLRTRSNGGQ